MGGLFLGYNYVINEHLIIGAELDLSYKLKADKLRYKQYIHRDLPPEDNIVPIELPLNRYLNGTLRARVGVILGDFLPYIAGGINVVYDLPNKNIMEYVDVLPTNTDDPKKVNLTVKIEGDDKLYIGYTLGAGVEYKIDKNLSIRAEYRYNHIISNQKKKISYDLEETIDDIPLQQDTIMTYGLENLSSDDWSLGISYHF